MFHNIFEKSKKGKENAKIIITADIHEKNSLVLSELAGYKYLELKIKSLDIGDYLIKNIIIERKTISDLINSIISKRILEQIKQMQNYDKKILIIEGNYENLKYSKNCLNIIRGFVLSVIIKQNIPVVFTKDYKDTALSLAILARQHEKEKDEPSLHSRIPKTIKERKIYVLESFPDIGPKKAGFLLKKFQNLLSIFNASEEELNEILKNNSKNFKEILEK